MLKRLFAEISGRLGPRRASAALAQQDDPIACNRRGERCLAEGARADARACFERAVSHPNKANGSLQAEPNRVVRTNARFQQMPSEQIRTIIQLPVGQRLSIVRDRQSIRRGSGLTR